MSQLLEGNQETFKWGITLDAVSNDSNNTYFRSFTYQGVEYSLFDCIYLYHEGGKETDIGKLVKIWRTKTGGKRGKVLWFFRPMDVYQHLRDYEPSWKELFLASGQGKGVSNIIPLEAIVGKCTVVCTSKDIRNTLPSKSDLRKADYFFSHTFDVGDLKLSDKFPDSIEMMKVELLFKWNRDKPKANGECRIGLAAGAQLKEKPINEKNPSSCEDFKRCNQDKPKAFGECRTDLAAGTQMKNIEKPTHSAEKLKKMDTPSKDFEHSNPNAAKAIGECRTDAAVAQMKDVENSIHKNERLKVGSLSTCEDFEHSVKKRKTMAVTEADFHSSPQDIQRWFTNLPWEERLKEAHEHGAIVHLVNLDPSYTSSDVQGIISSAFKLRSYAKIIQRGQFCNPLYGEALVIFKLKDDAEIVMNELQQKCLIVGEGRPLVACKSTLNDLSRTCNFPGHLVMDNMVKLKSNKRKAVFTSHCTQPNTVEHHMAIQWRELQQMSNLCWEALREDQAREISDCIRHTKSLQPVEFTEEAMPALEYPADASHSSV